MSVSVRILFSELERFTEEQRRALLAGVGQVVAAGRLRPPIDDEDGGRRGD